MLYIILITFIIAVLSPFVCHWRFKYLGWILALVPALFFLLFILQIPGIIQGDFITTSLPWLPNLGINLDFYLDGLSLLFVLLITGMGTLIVIYSYSYLDGNSQLGRYYCYLFLFMGSMLGAVLAANLIVLFVFWELTSLSSYLLISFNHSNKEARRAALQGLMITSGGGLVMLIGFLMIGAITSQFSMLWLLTNSTVLLTNQFYTLIVILILIGAFTKSAQYPFHFWLPNAMQAPTPISAYLHSATMVKLGIYLVARLTPVLGHTPLWIALLTIISSLTMISAALLALRATDLKLILAYSTIMALGVLLFLLASGNPAAVEAAMIFLLAHALYKGGLFLNVGIIDHATGTRELPRLGGLLFYLPITFLAVLLNAISMMGLPPVLGFISKEVIYNAKLTEPNFAVLLTAIALFTNIIFTTLALLMIIKPFWKQKNITINNSSNSIHEAKFSLWFAPMLLGLLGLVFGLYPWLIDKKLIAPAVSSILQKNSAVSFSLWHGVSPAFLLSVITVVVAIIIFYFYRAIHVFLKNSAWINYLSPQNFYEKLMLGLNFLALKITRLIQPGLLRIYTAIIFLAVSILTCFTFYYFKRLPGANPIPHAPWFGWLLVIIMTTAAIAIIITTSYLAFLAFFCIF